MRPLFNFIIEPINGELHSNTKKVGDVELILSSSIENHKSTQRIASVIKVPTHYNGPIKDDDLIVVNHNVFRKRLDVKGKEKFSSKLFKDGQYNIDSSVIYAHKHDWSEEWMPIEPYCFVKPLENDDQYSYEAEKHLFGEMVYTNEYLESRGVTKGMQVCFTPDSEYEFIIDDQKLYRINSSDICQTEVEQKN